MLVSSIPRQATDWHLFGLKHLLGRVYLFDFNNMVFLINKILFIVLQYKLYTGFSEKNFQEGILELGVPNKF